MLSKVSTIIQRTATAISKGRKSETVVLFLDGSRTALQYCRRRRRPQHWSGRRATASSTLKTSSGLKSQAPSSTSFPSILWKRIIQQRKGWPGLLFAFLRLFPPPPTVLLCCGNSRSLSRLRRRRKKNSICCTCSLSQEVNYVYNSSITFGSVLFNLAKCYHAEKFHVCFNRLRLSNA